MICTRRLQLVSLFGLAALVLGCSGTSGPALNPVSGKVTIGGQPAKNVLVTFQPTDAKLPAASGRVDDTGTYSLSSGSTGGKGAAAGTYKIVLQQLGPSLAEMEAAYSGGSGKQSAPPAGAQASFPDEYKEASTSPKEVTVTSGTNTINIEL
jgi:hypothetical protein